MSMRYNFEKIQVQQQIVDILAQFQAQKYLGSAFLDAANGDVNKSTDIFVKRISLKMKNKED